MNACLGGDSETCSRECSPAIVSKQRMAHEAGIARTAFSSDVPLSQSLLSLPQGSRGDVRDSELDVKPSLLEKLIKRVEGFYEIQSDTTKSLNGVRTEITRMVERFETESRMQLEANAFSYQRNIDAYADLRKEIANVINHFDSHKQTMEDYFSHRDMYSRSVDPQANLKEPDMNHGSVCELKQSVDSLQEQQIEIKQKIDSLQELAVRGSSQQSNQLNDPEKFTKLRAWNQRWHEEAKETNGETFLHDLMLQSGSHQNAGVLPATRAMKTSRDSAIAQDVPPRKIADRLSNQEEAVVIGAATVGEPVVVEESSRGRDPNCVTHTIRDLNSHYSFARAPKNALAELVMGERFNMLFAVVTIVNTILLGVMTDIEVRNAMKDPTNAVAPSWFLYVHLFFLAVFAIEITLRIGGERMFFFRSSQRCMNYFDLILILTVLAEILPFCPVGNHSFFRVFKTVNMFRAMRIVRSFRYFQELRLMLATIPSSLLSLSWAIMLLIILIYCCSVFFCNAVQEYIVDRFESAPESNHPMYIFYGSVPMTMYTLLLAISGGKDWYDLSEPLFEMGWFYILLFATYTVFVLFGMLNVLTGFFVERATENCSLDREMMIEAEKVKVKHFCTAMHEVFQEADQDLSGTISVDELRACLKRDDVNALFASAGLDDEEAEELFIMLDTSRLGRVSIEDFIMGSMRLKGQAKSLDLMRLQEEVGKLNRMVCCLGDDLKEALNYIFQTLAVQHQSTASVEGSSG